MPDAPHIALATCRELPDWEVDDTPFHEALRARGARIAHPVWDDPEVDWSAFDACLIRTTWDYADQRDTFVTWARHVEGSTRLFNPAEVVAWNTDKAYLFELEDAGIPIAPTIRLPRGESVDIAERVEALGWERAFLKPRVGATSRGTLRFDANPSGFAAARAHIDRWIEEEELLLQPYLEAVESHGEVSLIVIDGEITHAVRKTPVPGDYRVQDDFGATDGPYEPSDLEREIALKTAAHRAGLLYARVDFLETEPGRPVVNELEVVEPSLFFRHAPGTASRLADALLRAICG